MSLLGRTALSVTVATLCVALLTPAAQSDPVDGNHQIFHPGSMSPSFQPSTTVLECVTPEPQEGEDCYRGEPLTVQSTYVGRGASEPTIGVDADGNAFFAAAAFDGLGYFPGPIVSGGIPTTVVMRSLDGGVSWSETSPTIPVVEEPDPPVTVDPMVVVDQETGRIFNPELSGVCLYMNYSDDRGTTWTTNRVACGAIVVDHQTVALGPFPSTLAPLETSYPNVLWQCSNRVIDAICQRSLDGGLTWTQTTPSYTGVDQRGACGGLHGHVDTDSAGRLFVPKGHCGTPWVSGTADGGLTWTRTQVSTMGSAGTHIAVATDDADNVYVLWWDTQRRLPWLAVSKDHGLTFGSPMMVAPPGVNEVNFPVMEAGEAGKVAILFPGTTSSTRTDNKRPWNAYLTVSTNVLDANPTFVSTTANPIVDPIHRGNCGPGRCGPMWDFLDIVVSPLDGGFWAAITDGCTLVNNCNSPNGPAGTQLVGDGMAVRQLTGPRIRNAPPT